ncbi:MAG: hypothetical protein KF851_16925 [Pirellulaceae bacterium]|jgi:hypothetical protein|nr:hypothetical protein [Pirellulaceae bacterium]
MIYGFYHYSMSAHSQGTSSAHYVTQILGLSAINIFANTSLTGVSLGILNGEPGSAACYIKSYSAIRPNWSGEDKVELADPSHNTIYVHGCTEIVFRLAVRQARAFGNSMVLLLSPPLHPFSNPPSRKMHSFDFCNPSGDLISSLEFSLLEDGNTIDMDEHIELHKREIEKEFEIDPKKLKINSRKLREGSLQFSQIHPAAFGNFGGFPKG